MTPTKKEILKMTRKELIDYKWSHDLDGDEKDRAISDFFNKSGEFNYNNCFNCFYCFGCSYCSNCSHCLFCRNFHNHKEGYFICNVEVSAEEFMKKKKELKEVGE